MCGAKLGVANYFRMLTEYGRLTWVKAQALRLQNSFLIIPVLVATISLKPVIRSLFLLGGLQLTCMLVLVATASSNTSRRSTCRHSHCSGKVMAYGKAPCTGGLATAFWACLGNIFGKHCLQVPLPYKGTSRKDQAGHHCGHHCGKAAFFESAEITH